MTGPIGPAGPVGPAGPPGSLSSAYGSAYIATATATNIAANAPVVFNSTEVITGISHSTGTGAFTILSSGVYQVSYQIAVSTTAARNFALQVNGIAVPGGHAQTGPAGRNVSAQAVLNLVAGDIVRVVNISTAAVGLLVQGTATQQTNASMLVVRLQ